MKILIVLLAVVTTLASGTTAYAASAANQAEASTMTRARAVAIIAANQKIVSPRGIDETVKVHIGGIDQWLSIHGRDTRNPVLLFLHGGPASPDMPLAWTYQSPWWDYFTVVDWDQRGTGKTYASNSEAKMALGMNIQDMTDDAAQVVQYLRKRFGKRKIFLLGHSWGTVLGVRLAQRHPDWFYAYIGVSQVVNARSNEREGYAFALREAKKHGNAEAVKALQAIAPYPGPELTLQRVALRSKWESYYGGMAWGRKNFAYDANAWQLSPDYSEKDLAAIGKGSMFSLKYLLKPLLGVNFDAVTQFRCPVILFVGAHDETTSHILAEQWFAKLHAPYKRMVIFADSAHMVMEEQPGRFLVHLVDDALPLARKAGDAAPAEVETGTGVSAR
ncbi:alpha/beta hydrolase [Oleiagrimonas citrea]|uniref:Alpha/beta hydrolase n=1 Tax=Oleiagrimonas citrea TaxID=1665687 RepID=A0A846ZKW7_9GAMM|nr:alpha/beta hydrolase [Oleiagrimonas citrea]NKZ38160.1 alpha/beta hydrolase [Oleiagrimonas citrea]